MVKLIDLINSGHEYIEVDGEIIKINKETRSLSGRFK